MTLEFYGGISFPGLTPEGQKNEFFIAGTRSRPFVFFRRSDDGCHSLRNASAVKPLRKEKFSPKKKTTNHTKNEKDNAPLKKITVGDLLKKASPPLKIEDLVEKGALITVSMYWSCDVSSVCQPNYVVKRMDHGL